MNSNALGTYSHCAVVLLVLGIVGVEAEGLHELLFGGAGAYGGHLRYNEEIKRLNVDLICLSS